MSTTGTISDNSVADAIIQAHASKLGGTPTFIPSNNPTADQIIQAHAAKIGGTPEYIGTAPTSSADAIIKQHAASLGETVIPIQSRALPKATMRPVQPNIPTFGGATSQGDTIADQFEQGYNKPLPKSVITNITKNSSPSIPPQQPNLLQRAGNAVVGAGKWVQHEISPSGPKVSAPTPESFLFGQQPAPLARQLYGAGAGIADMAEGGVGGAFQEGINDVVYGANKILPKGHQLPNANFISPDLQNQGDIMSAIGNSQPNSLHELGQTFKQNPVAGIMQASAPFMPVSPESAIGGIHDVYRAAKALDDIAHVSEAEAPLAARVGAKVEPMPKPRESFVAVKPMPKPEQPLSPQAQFTLSAHPTSTIVQGMIDNGIAKSEDVDGLTANIEALRKKHGIPEPSPVANSTDTLVSHAKFAAAAAHDHPVTIETPEDVTQAFVHAGAITPEQANDFHTGIIEPTINHLAKQDGITPNEWVQKNFGAIVPGEDIAPKTDQGELAKGLIDGVVKNGEKAANDDSALTVVKPGTSEAKPAASVIPPSNELSAPQPTNIASNQYAPGHSFTMNIEGQPKSVTLDADTAQRVNQINTDYNRRVQLNADHPPTYLAANGPKVDTQQQASIFRQLGMQRSAELRRATGLFTNKEQAVLDKQEAGNYVGKPVSVGGKTGKVVGNVFGKVRVQFDDGSIQVVAAKELKAVPGIKKQASSGSDTQTLFQKSEEDNVPTFYSQAQRTVEQKMGNRMPAAQLEKTLLSNGVKPEEMKWSGLDDLIAQHKAGGIPLTKQEVLDHIAANNVQIKEINKTGDDTMFDKYTLPGGKNYREMLLTLPTSDIENRPIAKEVRALGISKPLDNVSVTDIEKAGGSEDLQNRWMYESDPSRFGGQYKSSHWDEPNVLAHVRMNDRTGPNGEKVLHVEEIQSDWGQAKRKGKDVPDLPFSKTWHELALKRVLRHAAENGYDRVSWTGGEDQNARYDLSKHVSRLLYNKSTNLLNAYDVEHPSTSIVSKHVEPDKLADEIGKEAADRLLNHPTRTDTSPYGETLHWLEGHDLSVGGSGMKGFYDKIVPDYLNKYGKKWGAKVEPTDIGGKTVQSIPVTDPMRKAVMGEGQTLFQKSDQTNTPQFKKWFGGSKVVDANGKPLVVYHGTSAHFDIFDRKLISENTLDYGINGHGFYFTSDPEEADLYANQGESWKSGANIKPVFLKMSNPLDLDFSSHSPVAKDTILALKGLTADEIKNVKNNNHIADNLIDNFTKGDDSEEGAKRFSSIVKNNGYDGIRIENPNGHYEIVAFHPEQIKSAIGNNGNFNPNDANILHQKGLGANGEKGSITWNTKDGKALIKVFQSADISTAAHEWSHLMRRSLNGDLLNTVEQHYGVQSGKWTTPHEERFARDFENYISSGKAPKPVLQTAFDKFKSWMGQIYKGTRNSPIAKELSPEMRQVFDKIYGKDTAENVHETSPEGAKAAEPGTSATKNPTETPIIDKLSATTPNGTGQKYAANLNLDRMGTTDEVRNGIIDYVNDHASVIKKARGGVIPMEETAKAAKELGLTVAQVTKGKPASIPAQNWAMAVRDLKLKKENDLRSVARDYKDDPSDKNQLLLDKATQEYATIVHATVGNAAEAGRTLNIHKVISKAINATESAANADLFKPIKTPIDIKTFGDNNKIFTLDRAKAARERLARTLNQSAPEILHQKSNTLYQSTEPKGKSVDISNPDTMKALTDIGGFHLEGGIRDAKDWMRQMHSDIQSIGGTATNTDLMKVWNNLKIEAAQRQGSAKLPRTESAVIVDQIARRLQRPGTQDFLYRITHKDGSTPEFDKLANNPEDLTPKDRQFLTDAFKESYRAQQVGKPALQRVVVNPDLNTIAKEARMQAKAERNIFATPLEAKNATRDLIAKRLSDGDREAFVKELNNVPEGDHATFVNVVRKYSRMTVGDSLVGLWKAGLLSHVGTLPKVAIAHTAFNVAEEAKRVPAALADAAWSATHDTDRQVAGLSIPAMMNAAKIGATKGVREASIILKEGEAGLASRGVSQHSYKGVEIPSEYNANLGPFSKLANAYVNSVSRTHGAVYHINKAYGFARSIDEQAQLAARMDAKNGLGNYNDRYKFYAENPTTNMIMNAASSAEELTLQNKNGITEAIQQVKGTAARHGVKPIVDVAVPFSTVPSNILLKSLEYTGGLPIGAAKAIKATILKEDWSADQQRSWANTVGRGTVGAAAITLGMYLYSKGLVSPPDNKTYTPATLKVGDKYFPISDKAPAGTLLTIGAIMASNKKTRDEDIFNALTADAPMAENNPLTNIVNNPGEFAGQEVKGFIPGFVQDYAGHMDKSRRITNVPGNTKQTFVNTVQSGIPKEREKLAPNGERPYDPADPLRLRNNPLAPRNIKKPGSNFGGIGSFGGFK